MGGAAGLGATTMLSSFTNPQTDGSSTEMFSDQQVDIENLRITDIKYVRMKFPGTVPARWNSIVSSGGGPHKMNYLEVHTNQGIIGRSIPKGPSSMNLGMIRQIRDENPFDVERIWDRMYRHERKPVAKGDYIKAMGSVDIAIWDIIGKALNLPVYRVLGGFRKKIRVYAAGGYYQEGKTTLDLAKEMEGYVSEGFRAVKMKVGGAPFNEDVERVRAVRDAIGPDVDLLIDANNKWVAYKAILFGRAIQKYNPVLPLYPVKDGYVDVPDRPGLGIDPDPKLVKKYRTN